MAGLKPCATTNPHPDYDYDNDNDSELNYMPYMAYMVEKAAVPSAFSLQPAFQSQTSYPTPSTSTIIC